MVKPGSKHKLRSVRKCSDQVHKQDIKLVTSEFAKIGLEFIEV